MRSKVAGALHPVYLYIFSHEKFFIKISFSLFKVRTHKNLHPIVVNPLIPLDVRILIIINHFFLKKKSEV